MRLMKAQPSAFSLGSVLGLLSIDEFLSIYNRENADLSLESSFHELVKI